MLMQCWTNVHRSKAHGRSGQLDPPPLRRHLDPTRQTNGFIEALNGLFQAAKRKARGYTRFATMRAVIFLIAGKLDFARINPHAA
jgi:hypothetical protein